MGQVPRSPERLLKLVINKRQGICDNPQQQINIMNTNVTRLL